MAMAPHWSRILHPLSLGKDRHCPLTLAGAAGPPFSSRVVDGFFHWVEDDTNQDRANPGTTLRFHEAIALTYELLGGLKHLGKDTPQRINVAASVELTITAHLFGAHGLRRSERNPGLRQTLSASFLHSERNTKVRDHRNTAVERDVLGLDVAVDYALRVSVGEPRLRS